MDFPIVLPNSSADGRAQEDDIVGGDKWDDKSIATKISLQHNKLKEKNKGSSGKKKTGGFQSLGLSYHVFGGVLRMGYKVPTPVQRKVLPVALSGRDIVAMARTGSGKTAAFLIPLLEKLQAHSSMFGARGIILSPTRELAQQTYKFALKMGKLTSLKFCLLQGGDKLDAQFEALSNNPDVLVCTPGRLGHLLLEMKNDLTLVRVEILIFDEADRLFELGFQSQLELIMSKCPEQRQTMLFSATLPKQLVEFSRAGLKCPEIIRLDTEHKLSENLKLAFFKVRTQEKIPILLHLVSEMLGEEEQTIIFVATRHHLEFVNQMIKIALNVETSIAYSSLDMEFRQNNLESFRDKKTKILIVTDLAARGLDIPLLNNVINFDFPPSVKLFVHRVGRAARQGRHGTAFSLVTNEEIPYLMDVTLFLGIKFEPNNSVRETLYSLENMKSSDVHFGEIPQNIIDVVSEKVEAIKHDKAEIQAIEKSMINAHKLYVKTRESASKHSVARAKDILNAPLGLHPLFLFERTQVQTSQVSIEINKTATCATIDDLASNKEDKALNSEHEYKNLLKLFRPKETVFEIEQKKIKSKAQADGKTVETSNFNDSFTAIKKLRKEVKEIKAVKAKQAAQRIQEATNNDDNMVMEDVYSARVWLREPSGETLPHIQETTLNLILDKPKLSRAQRKRIKSGQMKLEVAKANLAENSGIKYSKNTFKDLDQYINPLPQNYTQDTEEFFSVNNKTKQTLNPLATLSTEALDLLPDDEKQIAIKQKTYHWDKRKMKYIKATKAEHVKSGRMRNEAGATITSKDRGLFYQKWQKKAKKKVGQLEISEEPIQAVVTDVRKLSQGLRKQDKMVRLTGKKLNSNNRGRSATNHEIKDEKTLRKHLKTKETLKERNRKGRKKIIKAERAAHITNNPNPGDHRRLKLPETFKKVKELQTTGQKRKGSSARSKGKFGNRASSNKRQRK